jgi:hypothetical protein
MNPSVKHGTKGSIFQSVKMGLDHFPKKVQEKGIKTKTCLWYSENP